MTVQPTRTELPVTGGREVSLALAGGGMFVVGVLLLLLRRIARDH
ncbi:MAG: LPXTG cell wall anchor domain-containing protein [Micromonosporaceae bacterium]|nr:LPXTG cell wall anchor domain-containing protein [Micromonosporaceae bacterium]